MIDPFSILAAICGVITALKALHEWWELYQQNRLASTTENSTNPVSNLLNAFTKVWTRYNRIVAYLGLRFSSSFNDKLMKNLNDLRPRLKILQMSLRDLEKSHQDTSKLSDGGLLAKLEALNNITNSIEGDTKHSLTSLCLTQLPSEEDFELMEDERIESALPHRQFCEGAQVFQTGQKDEQTLSTLAKTYPSKSGWGYICKYCGLEVGHYPAIRISHTGKPFDSSLLLTASHLVAFRSLHNRRAFYRCLPCYKQRKFVEFPSALAFEKHMKQHVGFTLLNKKDENERVAWMLEKEVEFMKGAALDNISKEPNDLVPVVQSPRDIPVEEAISTSETFNIPQPDLFTDHQEQPNQEDYYEVSDMEEETVDPPFKQSSKSEAKKPEFYSNGRMYSETEFARLSKFNALSSQSTRPEYVSSSFPLGSGTGSPVPVRSRASSVFEVEAKDGKSELASNSMAEEDGKNLSLEKPLSELQSIPEPKELPAHPITIPVELEAIMPQNPILRTNASLHQDIKPSSTSHHSNDLPRPFHSDAEPEIGGAVMLSAPHLTPNRVPYPVTPITKMRSVTPVKPEFWIMIGGVYIGIANDETVIEQEEMPLDSWIETMPSVRSSTGKKFMMKMSATGDFVYK